MTSHAHSHGHAHASEEDPALAELLDLDAEVLHEHLSEVTAWVAGQAGDAPVRRVVDLGAGTGTGTLALLERFPAAHVTAVDRSEEMLARVRDRAGRAGVAARVDVVPADLDAVWPRLGPADLVWAAAALHHLADPHRALSEVLAVLRPGGSLSLVELEGFPRFLPDDVGLGRPGLEARCHAALAAARQVPSQGVDWTARLAAAGFRVQAERVFAVDLVAPLPVATGRYAQLCLGRVRAALGDALDGEDDASLDALLSDRPEGVRHRGDLTVRTRRSAWVARRP